MSGFTGQFLTLFEHYAKSMPLELLSFGGALVEEIVAPIPSPIVMATVGSFAAAQHVSYLSLFGLAIVGSVGKTLACLFFYLLADKGEDFVVGKFGKYLGITHKEIEGFGKRLNNDWRDDVLLLTLRAIPVMPSTPISVVSGLIKLKLSTFIWTTFVGTIIRNCLFLLLGYTSISSYESIASGLGSIESVVQILLLVILASVMVGIYVHRQRHTK